MYIYIYIYIFLVFPKGKRRPPLNWNFGATKIEGPISHVYLVVYGRLTAEDPAVAIGAAQRDEENSVFFQSDIDRALQLSLSIEDLSADKKEEGNESNNKVADAPSSYGKRKSQQTFTATKDNEGEEQDAGISISVDVRPPCLSYRKLKKKEDFATPNFIPQKDNEGAQQDADTNISVDVCLPCISYRKKKKKEDSATANCADCSSSRKNQKKDASSDEEENSSNLGSSLSSQEEDEDLDLLTVGLEADMRWKTLEDEEMERIESLAQYLREDPLCPPPLSFDARVLKQEGLNLPLVHCAFKGCSWTSDTRPCLRAVTDAEFLPLVTQQGLWRNLPCRKQREDGISGCCGEKTCLRQHIIDEHISPLTESCGLDR